MSDDVSVAELLEREGWTEQERTPRSRVQVVAVMLAVIVGCGLAAIMVKLGADAQTDDSGAVYSLPHAPTGGLAGGGLPENRNTSQRTKTSTTVVVTNESTGSAGEGIPWLTTPRSSTRTETVATTTTPPGSPTEPGDPSTGGTTGPGDTGDPTDGTTTTRTRWTPPSCVLVIICVG